MPTPLTEIYFKTAFEQGQQLNAFFTINTSKQFNFSLSYQGVRSLGNYQQSLTSTGNLLITSNYFSKNNRYNVRFHVASHDILNRENGGLTQNSLALFINDDPEFSDRGRLDVNFEDAENNLKGVRFYMSQEYSLIQKADSTSTTALTLGNSISGMKKSCLSTVKTLLMSRMEHLMSLQICTTKQHLKILISRHMQG